MPVQDAPTDLAMQATETRPTDIPDPSLRVVLPGHTIQLPTQHAKILQQQTAARYALLQASHKPVSKPPKEPSLFYRETYKAE